MGYDMELNNFFKELKVFFKGFRFIEGKDYDITEYDDGFIFYCSDKMLKKIPSILSVGMWFDDVNIMGLSKMNHPDYYYTSRWNLPTKNFTINFAYMNKMLKESRGFYTILLNRKTLEIPEKYRFISIDRDGNLEVWLSKPLWQSGVWQSPQPGYPVASINDTIDIYKTKTLLWKTQAGNFFDFDRIFKDEGFSSWQLRKNVNLLESQKVSFVEGDDVEIPNGYKFVAVDANGDICVFKEEPTLSSGGKYPTYKGKGKAQVGVAVWNWSKLPSKPDNFDDAKSEVEKIMPDFVFEIKDGFKLGEELDSSGAFKIVFPKYGDIEKL